MAEPHKIRKRTPPPPMLPRQIAIAFESSATRGLSGPERVKAVRCLAHLLILTAGIAAEDRDDER